jgi:hypothetical protein
MHPGCWKKAGLPRSGGLKEVRLPSGSVRRGAARGAVAEPRPGVVNGSREGIVERQANESRRRRRTMRGQSPGVPREFEVQERRFELRAGQPVFHALATPRRLSTLETRSRCETSPGVGAAGWFAQIGPPSLARAGTPRGGRAPSRDRSWPLAVPAWSDSRLMKGARVRPAPKACPLQPAM